MTVVKVILIGSLLLLPVIIQDSYAHGIISIKDCTKANLPFNQELYKEDIMSINQAARFYVEGNPQYKMSDLASYMVNVYLNQPVELAHCLRDLGVNPASVAQLTPLAYNAITYDKTNLHGYSHDFLSEIPAPQDVHMQNALPVQHQTLTQERVIMQTQEKPSPLGVASAQATEGPVQTFESTTSLPQISTELALVTIGIVVVVSAIILLGIKSKRDRGVLAIPQRRP